MVIQLTLFVEVRVAGVAPELLAMLGVLLAFYAGIERGPILAFGCRVVVGHLSADAARRRCSHVRDCGILWSPRSKRGFSTTLVGQLAVIVGLGSVASVVGYSLIGEVVGQRGLIDVEMLRVAAIVGLDQRSADASPCPGCALDTC